MIIRELNKTPVDSLAFVFLLFVSQNEAIELLGIAIDDPNVLAKDLPELHLYRLAAYLDRKDCEGARGDWVYLEKADSLTQSEQFNKLKAAFERDCSD